ncbi:hypothetical protein UFOVP843_30 [uncultured Caudovirales phage]|uniref:DdrB-like domain-containing protein n=1 Tax=uncultured Caudovirales phage TaxID=2100421 RepID=A0A6J5PAL2_9CAUD|nr:hypothetical protein UFOVP843_30 [uncultured Caudovirales phage]CAB4172406.1 hypothetical protein UFOVP936_2 [uncultured Caudovirales phage]
MTGLIFGEPLDSVTLRGMGVDALESTAGQVAGAVAGSAWASNPSPRLVRAQQRGDMPFMDPDMGAFGASETAPEPTLDPEDANKRYGLKGVLSFDKPVSEAVAKDLHDAHAAEMKRQDIIERRGDGLMTSMVARGATSLAVALLDPLNLAIGFIPVVGEARGAAIVASAGSTAGRVAARGAIGAANGAAGTAMLEPLNIVLDRQEHNDWHMSEALRDIAFGGLIGGGLHIAARHPRGAISRRLDALAPEDRAAALQAGIAQHIDDGPVNVAPLIDTAELRSAYADRLAARGDAPLGSYSAYTPEGLRVDLRPEVVEASSLIASHDAGGVVNPAFPHAEGMQPRDRTAAASQAQIVEMASRFEPERLGPSSEASTGAPIVNADHVVESGNGRIMALRRLYGDPALKPQADAYRAYLSARGHDVEGMTHPVLIGRRVTDLSPEDTRAFVRGANERATLGMNATEQARLDAGRAGKSVEAYRPGPVAGPGNKGFVAAFMAQVPAEERAGMILSNGDLSGIGAARIRSALLAHAYGDALGPTLERVLNGDVGHMKAVAGALQDVAGAWSQMRGAAARGDIPAGLDITGPIGEAVQLMDRAHANGQSVATLLAQMDMLNAPSPVAEAMLRLMFRDESLNAKTGRQFLTDFLDRYVEQAMEAKPGGGLFGDAETTAADILGAIGGTDARVKRVESALKDAAATDARKTAEYEAASLEADRAAKAAADTHVGDGAEASLFGEAADQAPRAQMSAELREAMQWADEAAAALDIEVAQGRLTEADLAPLRAKDAAVEHARVRAQAADAAASCLIGQGLAL